MGRLDESQQQPGERRLAAAGASDDPDGPATGDVDIDVVENRLGLVVGESDGAAGNAQRTRRRRRRAAVDDRRLDGEQLDDSVHRSVGLLDHLELIGELLQRSDHQVHVLEQQERGAQRDRPIADESSRQHQRADESDGDIDLQRPPHPQERGLPSHGAGDRLGAVLDETPHGVILGTVGAQIFDRREALLDPAVQLGVRSHLVRRLAHRSVAHAEHEEQRHTQVDEHPDPESPVEHDQHAEHPREHDHRPGDLRNDLRQEVGDVGDVAVDSLDELARRVLAVELVVEAEHVAGDVEAQPVGDPPGRHRRRAHDDDVEYLGDDRDDEEQDAELDDLARRRAIRRLVDDATDDQRSGEGAGGRRGDERAEDRPPAGIRPDQRRQGAPARRRCLRHVVSLAA